MQWVNRAPTQVLVRQREVISESRSPNGWRGGRKSGRGVVEEGGYLRKKGSPGAEKVVGRAKEWKSRRGTSWGKPLTAVRGICGKGGKGVIQNRRRPIKRHRLEGKLKNKHGMLGACSNGRRYRGRVLLGGRALARTMGGREMKVGSKTRGLRRSKTLARRMA